MYYLKAESEEALFAALDASGATIRVYDMEDPANVRPADLDPDEAWAPTGEYDSLPVAGVDRDGHSLILNTDLIISFFEHTQEDGTAVTAAYGMNNNSWEVQETIDEVMAQIRE